MGTWVLMLEGMAASCGAVVISNPFEVVKTRLQLQGELQRAGKSTTAYNGLGHGLAVIGRNEGLRGLQKGLGVAVVYQATMNGTRLGLYEPVKATVGGVLGPGAATNIVSGGACGFIGALIGSPLFLIKTRLQSCASGSSAQVGQQHHYRGIGDAFKTIIHTEGVVGLYHGVIPAAIRTCVGSAVQLASYDQFKKDIGAATGWGAHEFRLHLCCSFFSSAVVVSVMNPFDVVMTRTYNNPGNEYSANFPKAFAKIARAEGIAGLYKGSTALWARMGPHTIMTFVLLEQLRSWRREVFPNIVEV